MKKRYKKQVLGLRKWNKIVSFWVKDLKKKKKDYDIREIRKKASVIYTSFKEIPLSKITKRKVVSKKVKKKDTITIGANEVPDYWFNDTNQFGNWYQIGEWVVKFANAYPDIPVLVKTKKNELTTKGEIGTYQGSVWQKFTEDLREEFGELESSEFPVFVGTPAYKKNKQYTFAFWGEMGVKLPKIAPKPAKLEPVKKKKIEEIEEKLIDEGRKKRKPKEKVPLKKKVKKKVKIEHTKVESILDKVEAEVIDITAEVIETKDEDTISDKT